MELLTPPRLTALGPGTPNLSLRPRLAALTVAEAFAGTTVVDAEMAQLCLAGLWLWHDFLSESHAISQQVHTPSGSYWHGIMHRREPDYENAKYWFRRVGRHPVFEPLFVAARELAAAAEGRLARSLSAGSDWDPYWFVDQCAGRPRGDDEQLLRRIAGREWELLFDYCYRHAVGQRADSR